MGLADTFRKSTDEYKALQKAKVEARKKAEEADIKKYIDRELTALTKRAKEFPGRTCDDIKVDAVISAATYHECTFNQLTNKAQALYTRLEDEGFKVQIQRWKETDYDEPGAFVGGWTLLISW